jgi:ribokinase
MDVLVFGSLNMDLVTRASRLPIPGETVTGRDFSTVPGGKGANQAVAIARLGVSTRMVGRIGEDSFGWTLLGSLQQAGVQTSSVQADASTHTGIAAIAVDDAGENHIIVVAGANGHVNSTDVDRLKPLLSRASALLLQLEIPLSAVQQAAHAAHQSRVLVILDPAPARSGLPEELYASVDILTPNQTEAAQLVGFPVSDLDSAEKAAHLLQEQGVETVIIKLGQQGAFCATPNDAFHVPGFEVDVVDTVGAGDAFNAGLVAAITDGRSLREAVVLANAVAALSITKPGAQPSMPDRATVEAFLGENGMAQ